MSGRIRTKSIRLTKSVFLTFVDALVLSVKVTVNGNVPVAMVSTVRAAFNGARDLVALGDAEDLFQIENSLFPVRVLGNGRSGEVDGLVAF